MAARPDLHSGQGMPWVSRQDHWVEVARARKCAWHCARNLCTERHGVSESERTTPKGRGGFCLARPGPLIDCTSPCGSPFFLGNDGSWERGFGSTATAATDLGWTPDPSPYGRGGLRSPGLCWPARGAHHHPGPCHRCGTRLLAPTWPFPFACTFSPPISCSQSRPAAGPACTFAQRAAVTDGPPGGGGSCRSWGGKECLGVCRHSRMPCLFTEKKAWAELWESAGGGESSP